MPRSKAPVPVRTPGDVERDLRVIKRKGPGIETKLEAAKAAAQSAEDERANYVVRVAVNGDGDAQRKLDELEVTAERANRKARDLQTVLKALDQESTRLTAELTGARIYDARRQNADDEHRLIPIAERLEAALETVVAAYAEMRAIRDEMHARSVVVNLPESSVAGRTYPEQYAIVHKLGDMLHVMSTRPPLVPHAFRKPVSEIARDRLNGFVPLPLEVEAPDPTVAGIEWQDEPDEFAEEFAALERMGEGTGEFAEESALVEALPGGEQEGSNDAAVGN